MLNTKASGFIRGGLLLLILLLLADFAIVFNIPIVRQVSAVIFLIILPGLLIIFLLRLNNLGTAEKIVLTVGISVAVLMFLGWILSQAGSLIGYSRPLATNIFLAAINIILIILAIGAYLRNKQAYFSFPFRLQFNTAAKWCVLVASTFPFLSIVGTYYLNITNDNSMLLAFLFLVPVLVVLITVFSNRISTAAYPVVIIMVSVSLLTMYWLRSEHILGRDVHEEYYFFYMTLTNAQWAVLEGNVLDSTLSISVLPAIFQSLINLSGQEYLFKGVYTLIGAFMPLTVYVISKKYIGVKWGLLATFYFISQASFLMAPGNARTNIAIFFFALCIMVLFHSRITGMKKKGLFLIFVIATVLSHYTTTYIFLFLLIFAFLLSLIFRKYCQPRTITWAGIAFLAVLAFLWYSQLVQAPYGHGLRFLSETAESFQQFFLKEARAEELGILLGFEQRGQFFLEWVHRAVTWLSFTFIAIGTIWALIKHKDTLLATEPEGARVGFLRSRFEMEYLLLSLMAAALLAVAILIPFISVGYDVIRIYSQTAALLSTFFVIGGIVLSRSLRINAHVLPFLILIPYFLFTTWAGYEVFGVHKSYILSSEAAAANYEVVYEQETLAAQWLKKNMDGDSGVYTADYYGGRKLISQGKISSMLIDYERFQDHSELDGYIYLSHNNVVNQAVVIKQEPNMLSDYSDMFDGKNIIYNNGGSEIYR
ncbi:MAG: hypothetical protein A2144_00320 [Chloroflexi bacterium RBG_16_50_9]|nr:MAG: hypothetical protein A2144_00320 [Chloroflexi bacterium RBG_16_50_9]